MALSKSTRISIMLAIDAAFFLLELGVGLAVGSLALMADAFHMLNDIISLAVGLWAVKAAQRPSTDKFSFGWLRAELLGAFFNAVFLIALCISILLEAIPRLVSPPEIGNPLLILIVGSLGLLSNGVGFLVLGGHGHSHGPGEDHGHSHGDEHSAAEEGHSHAHGGAGHEHEGHLHNHEEHGHSHETGSEQSKVQSGQSYADAVKTKTGSSHIRFSGEHGSGSTASNAYKSPSKSKHRRRTSGRFVNAEDFSIHPASFRQEIIEASRSHDSTDSETGESESEEAIAEDEDEPTEESRLINGTDGKSNGTMSHSHSHKHSHSRTRGARSNSLHANHNHKKPKKAAKGGHGHNHADMGMNAMILHVIGDALGNVGVIVSALVIMFTEWSGKYYADPVVSLFITLIILRSTIPLTVASARILLQATPDHIDVNEVKEDIQDIPGVVSCHHVHIWQLSDTQLVASMHIQISFPISEAGGEKYMEVARAARKCLHEFGIHSATIQPEFCTDKDHDHNSLDGATGTMGLDGIVGQPKCRMDDDCLLECVADCKSKGCCSTQASTSLSTDSSTHNHSEHDHSAHDHSEHDGHSH